MITKCPPRVREYLLAHPEQRLAEAAVALGVPLNTLRKYCRVLVKEGLRRGQRRGVLFSAIAEAVAEGLTIRVVARRVGLSEYGVRWHLRAHGTWASDLRQDRSYTAAEAARLLGYDPRKGGRLMAQWQAAGLSVRAPRGGPRQGRPYRVTAVDLMAFLERADCPIQPERIKDPDWRAYAIESRGRNYTDLQSLFRPDRPPVALCPDCAAPVSVEGNRCKSCARKGSQHAA